VSCGPCGGFRSVQGSWPWLAMALSAVFAVWLDNEWPTAGVLPWRGSKRDRPPLARLLVVAHLGVRQPGLDVLAGRAAGVARRQEVHVNRPLLAHRTAAGALVQQIRQRCDVRSLRFGSHFVSRVAPCGSGATGDRPVHRLPGCAAGLTRLITGPFARTPCSRQPPPGGVDAGGSGATRSLLLRAEGCTVHFHRRLTGIRIEGNAWPDSDQLVPGAGISHVASGYLRARSRAG
jgi:hypothetical protein